jgi:hypothetical protein
VINWLVDLSAPARYGVLMLTAAGIWFAVLGVLLLAARSGEEAAERTEELASPEPWLRLRALWDASTWRRYRHRAQHRAPGRIRQLTSGLVSWDH